jgi:polar amino acid transport system substrate-binding protein
MTIKKFIFFVLVTFGFITPLNAQDRGITVVTGDDYPPITSRDLDDGGLATKVVLRAFKISNIHVNEIKWMPWARGISLTEANKIDVAFPWGKTKERDPIFYYSDPIYPMINYGYVSATASMPFTKKEDLYGKTYCNPNGYGDFGIIKELFDKQLLLRQSPLNMMACFKMLNLGRVDFVVSSKSDAEFAIKESGLNHEAFKREDFELARTPLGILVSKKNKRGPQIIAAFNKGLKALTETGELRQIYDQFHFDDYLD